jgi:hypothetical protein
MSAQPETMLRADLHLHTDSSPDSLISVPQLIQRCVAKDIDCVAVTDHNTTSGAFAVREAAPFKIIVGEEVKTSEGEIIGLFLSEEIPRDLSPEETVRRIKEQGGLVCIPHPFDRVRREPLRAAARERILPHVDIIEAFNARVTFRSDNAKARDFAQEHDLAMSAGSDSHSLTEIGHAYVEMPDFDTPQQFLEALRQGRIVGRLSNPMVHLASTWSKLAKRLSGRRRFRRPGGL